MVLDDGVVAGSIAVELTGADAGSTTAAQIAATVQGSVNVPVELTGADAGATTAAQVESTVGKPPVDLTAARAFPPLLGIDGNNAPAKVEGVDFITWVGIQGRAFTWYRREPFRPAFGLGLVDGLKSPTLTQDEWRSRLRASFADLSGGDAYEFAVDTGGGQQVRLLTRIRES